MTGVGRSGYTASVGLLTPILSELGSRGVDVGALVRAAGADAAQLEDPSARVPIEWTFAIGLHATEVLGDPAFGLHLAERYQRHIFGTLDYLAHNCQTLGEANDALCRFYKLLQDAIETGVEHEDGRITVFNSVPASLDPPPGILENSIANMVVIGRELSGRLLVPCEVRFRHSAPSYTSEHRRIFRCPVTFEAERDAVVWPASVFQVKIREPDRWLSRVLERHATELLERMAGPEALAQRVRWQLAQCLPRGGPSCAEVARKLGVSERTLRRRLQEEGTHWGAVLDEFRRALADRYLADPEMGTEEVAHALGYAAGGAFRRAFRRWHGQSPGAYRRHLRQGD